uniref:Alpha-amylase n=1 Tax=Plectus sambesii TaxID=2011161 RepID=A0A914W7E2_9BILA
MRLLAGLALAQLLLLLAVADRSPYWYDKTQTLVNRQTLVHLFEWKWTDIANECESFLQHFGYGAVQVSPPNEHITVVQNNDMPWWIRYQPVSYQLSSRSGSSQEFADMVNRCNNVGVRIIVDIVLNHMVGVGQKSGQNGVGSSGPSSFDGTDNIESFPGVPYGSGDTNDARCHHDIDGSDYQNNANNVRECRLVGLLDLNQGSSYVQGKMVDYLNSLIDMGVAGFRADAAKHMWPNDLKAIFDATKNLRSDIFGQNQRAFIVQEVIDQGGEATHWDEYILNGRYTNFNYGAAVSRAAKGQSNWNGLTTLGPGYGGYGNGDDHDVLAFIDNHDNQRDDNTAVVTYKDGDRYKLAVAYMLAWTYGYPRVMSSYSFTDHNQGPPNNGAGNGFSTRGPSFNGDQTCNPNSGWVCEHRWPEIRAMALFRSACQGAAVSDLMTDNQRIAFAREFKGYFALNSGSGNWQFSGQTTLAAGTYCDVYSGALNGGSCTGASITVGSDGRASFNVPQSRAIAIHVNSRIGGAPPPPSIPGSWQTTVVFLKRSTQPGENLFIRGGNTQGHTCSSGPFAQSSDPCAISIAHTTTTPFVYAEYQSWSQNDDYLDFEGAESNQGTHDGQPAFGSPLAYSTNDQNAVEYQPLNRYGPDYWMVQIQMDCSKTVNGWFELKGYQSPDGGWESDVNQAACTGTGGGTKPFNSNNHVARCGYVNVFIWGDGSCRIDRLS